MKALTQLQSELAVRKLIDYLKPWVAREKHVIEFFRLTLQVPHYEMLNCALIQSKDKKKGILYEALTNRYFFIEIDKTGKPELFTLTKSVYRAIPQKIKEKMFWVCGNKTDKALEAEDFGTGYQRAAKSM